MLKKGAPTDTFSPDTASTINGHKVPINTVAAAVVKNRLLRPRPPSRDIGWNTPPDVSEDARKAKSASEPPMKTMRIIKIKTPRVGSVAKAWTEVSTPDRTRNVPSSDSENVRIARRTVQIFS